MANICFSAAELTDRVPPAAAAMPALAAPVHCGVPMEWKTPAFAAMSVYSMAPATAAVELPPLWRCACGFQVDGIVRPSKIPSMLSR